MTHLQVHMCPAVADYRLPGSGNQLKLLLELSLKLLLSYQLEIVPQRLVNLSPLSPNDL